MATIRKRDSWHLRNWFDHFQTTLNECAQFSFNTGSDGFLFDSKGMIFHPETLYAIIKAVDLSRFDIDINMDLLHVNGPLNEIFPDAWHPGSNNEQMNCIIGNNSLLFPSCQSEFRVDSPPTPQYQQWGSMFKNWLLQKSSSITVIVLVLPARVHLTLHYPILLVEGCSFWPFSNG